ncbi:MAG TPA: type 1 glutamine amidotransferase [Acidobacteriota bacterium]|nr:type 1 glutamine amidotransferase [Acidobacteriota bacterium]
MNKIDIRVAIIDNSIDKSIYDPVNHWSQFLDVKWVSFRAKKSDFPDDTRKNFTHIILTGSEASIMDRSPWVLDEIEFVKEAVSQKIPILGSCYGHQMIALALAGPQCVRRSPFPEIGWIPIKILRENALLGKKGLFHSYTIHFDEVIGLGNDYDILASTDLCSIHAFQKKKSCVWGIQSHPEISPEKGKTLLKNLINQGEGPLDIYKKALCSIPEDSGIIKHIIDAFIKY